MKTSENKNLQKSEMKRKRSGENSNDFLNKKIELCFNLLRVNVTMYVIRAFLQHKLPLIMKTSGHGGYLEQRGVRLLDG